MIKYAKNFRQDLANYMIDLILFRRDKVIFKTSYFIKRCWLRTANFVCRTETNLKWVWSAIKHGAVHTWHGLKHLWHDGLWYFKKKTLGKDKYSTVAYKDKAKLREI